MKRPAFSLLEVMITMGITSVIVIMATTALTSILGNSRNRLQQSRALEQMVKVTEYVTGLIREAQPSPTGAYPIVAASTTSLTLYAARAGTQVDQIRFFLQNGSLFQGVIQPVGSPATYPAGTEVISTLLTNISSATVFSYYTSAYTGSQAAMSPISLPTIRVARLQLTFDPAAQLAPGPYSIDLQTHFRNLKDNY